jgi:hypothetical protein
MEDLVRPRKDNVMQKIARLTVVPGAAVIVCALIAASSGCSEMGKRYITVVVESDPPGATVHTLIDDKLGGQTFSPGSLGTTPTGKRTMHFAFGAPGVGNNRIGIRIHEPGFEAFEVLFTRDECYPSPEEAHKNVKHIFAKLTPAKGASAE